MNMTIPQPEREEWWESLLKKLMLTSPHSSYIEFIPALLTESRRRARAEMLEKVKEIVADELSRCEHGQGENELRRTLSRLSSLTKEMK